MIARLLQLSAFVVVSGFCLAQRGEPFLAQSPAPSESPYRGFNSSDYERGGYRGRSRYRGPDISYDRRGVPDWPRDPLYPNDVFTFVRLLYNSGYGKWATDWPDSDLNLSFRLQQLTALKVNPDPVIVEARDPRLFDYPWLYVIEPGGGDRWGGYSSGLNFSDEEAEALRRYTRNGGFIMVDDFWGEDEWDVFYQAIKCVFPDREPVDLDISHEIFHCVYDLKEKPQVPSIHHYLAGQRYERYDASEVHYRAIYDDKGRMIVFIGHNTDLGDGWEREGENVGYFREYSEPKSYPMGINVLFYAMTH